MLVSLAQQDIEGRIPPCAIERSGRSALIQVLGFRFGKVVVIVVAALQLKEEGKRSQRSLGVIEPENPFRGI